MDYDSSFRFEEWYRLFRDFLPGTVGGGWVVKGVGVVVVEYGI